MGGYHETILFSDPGNKNPAPFDNPSWGMTMDNCWSLTPFSQISSPAFWLNRTWRSTERSGIRVLNISTAKLPLAEALSSTLQ